MKQPPPAEAEDLDSTGPLHYIVLNWSRISIMTPILESHEIYPTTPARRQGHEVVEYSELSQVSRGLIELDTEISKVVRSRVTEEHNENEANV